MPAFDDYMRSLAVGAQPDTGRELPDTYGWEHDPVLKGYVGSPYSPLRPANVHSVALESARQVKSGETLLYGFTVLSTNVAAQFIQLFDSPTAPASGAIPTTVFTVAASSNLNLAWIPPRVFLLGLWLANSSTSATLTPGSADCYFDVQYL